jgi:hypothetical protein
MKKFKTTLLILPLLASCNIDFKKIEAKAALINHYEQVSLKFAKENRELHAEVNRLKFEIEKLKHGTSQATHDVASKEAPSHSTGHTESNEETHVKVAVGEHGAPAHHEVARSVASVQSVDVKKDFVEFKTYKWRADDLIKIADKEFKAKNFEKAAQFYSSVLTNYPENKMITDEFFFKAGIAAFESGEHHDWTLTHFEALMSKYPTSQYFRSAKLWVALTHMKMGDKKKFYSTVEEFRKKYRNTNEWKILSSYYEKIEEKTNE